MLKKLLNLIRFWLLDVPMWIPQRVAWHLKRKKCVKKGCDVDILREEESRQIVYRICNRCGAYKGKRGDNSEYELIEIVND